MTRTLVLSGWAAGPEAWNLCTFHHDWLFSYAEQMDGLPERVMADFDYVLLVGWSMGGSGALRLALRHPETVRGLVLVAATPRMMEDKASGWAGMSERRLQALWLGTRTVYEEDPDPTYRVADMLRGLDDLRTTDLREDLRRLRGRFAAAGLPVEILQAERDPIVRPANAAFLKEIFPDATLTMVPGCEHVLPVTSPELVDAAVRRIEAAAGRCGADTEVLS